MISILSDLILCVLMLILFILFMFCIVSEKVIALGIDLFLSLYLSLNKDLVYGFIKACLEFITSGEFIFDISAKAFALTLFKTGVFFAIALFVFYILGTLCISENQ